MRAAQHPSPAHNHSIPAQYTQSQHMVTAHGRTRSQHRCRAATAFIRSTQSQHTITTCNHSTQSQRTVTTHDHSTRSQHTVTAHGHSPSHTHLTAVDRCGALVDVLVPDAVQRPQHRISTTTRQAPISMGTYLVAHMAWCACGGGGGVVKSCKTSEK